MPPKANQVKQSALPPKSVPGKTSAEASTTNNSSDAVASGPKPLHLLLRTANKVLLQTLAAPTTTADPPSASTAAPATSSSSLGFQSEPITLLKDGDFTECQAIISKTGDFAVVASATDVRIVFLNTLLAAQQKNGAAAPTAIKIITIAEDKVCHLMFSPLETFLVTYRMRDPKRPTEGNMAVYNLQTIFENVAKSSAATTTPPTPVLKCVQGAWPAMVWTPNEDYCVRYAKGLLMLHEGIIKGGEDAADLADGGEDDADSPSASKSSNSAGPRCKIELQLPQNKEPVFETPPLTIPVSDAIPNTDKIPALDQLGKALPPLFALFKPHNKNQPATLGIFRLPMFREPLFSIQLQKAEGAKLEWNRNATHMCVIANKETEKGDNSFYEKTSLVLVNIRDRKDLVVKFPGVSTIGAGATYEAIHDVKWSPTRDEFIVIHGTMPRNKATLYNDKGQALFQFGEAPRNLAFWSPNGSQFVIGGTGSLVGEFQFYHREGLDNKAKPALPAGQRPSSASPAPLELGGKLGSFNEKSSEQTWSPDSRFLLCATVFGKLRIDNKLFVYKHNGERCCESKFKNEDGNLHQATWIPMPAGHYGQPRAPSPTVAAAAAPPKPALFKARGSGNSAAAAALSRAPLASAATAAKPAGLLPGENPIAPKQKGRR
eukprot:GILI01026857.1.p1 GENE.GILI01026857.1~~GILI01026857.1.p1  ORF type:complete len:660 (-),score=161.85 GILI01026857.1:91-2070(-)